ncbi:hypothetical protein ACFYSC_07995 [Streptosporangium sp. NPDC004379]|uniref:hypothetical protein n=1 Tax=Streptosporangium sp. NPDC004379 TaxID=3366189 RepID=UPI00369F8AE9
MTTPVKTRPEEGAGRRALWLAVAAAVLTVLLPPAGIVMSAIALVVSVRAIRTLRSATRPTGSGVVAVVVSALALVLAMALAATQFYFRDELAAYTDCRTGAGTVAAQDECQQRLERAMEKKLPFVRPGELHLPIAP